ncbi:DUF4410 domain-containing protein [Geobacter sulfurreducens]|jgi:hypothetical protein|uniref:DUF4410 domain-containing protein n=1 Tax=Geobacter sulfurreducens (strain ATCC 51573 / DSM 12127 / PCA) TaxID=243231 RepID=Q74C04_GEOSL|nr:DUF4410 domain-containing protein [Geobacter sulfurreducens]AAR35248.1 hypothetical protein GSU1872 [Geobacter sulfurreducens PCA]UAC02614.1 DUF4410 domain-containing protein [Geobacter sulfurreducens]UTG91336.1 DUF4410 domain-containing protein [Geobacter sulfurreducens]HBB70235.1 DUF4410 domain-containing protein [Geobacter sulfurreducens]
MKRILVALALTFVAGFAFAADENPLPKPDVLTEETVYTSQRLSAVYDTIIIRDLTTEGAELSNLDSEEMTKLEAMKPLLVRTVTDSIEMELKLNKLFKTIQKNTQPKGKAVILEGAFTEFNAGNRAVRFWVGFGAGKTYLKVKGRLIDAESGKELATFEDRETGYRGTMTLENFADLFPHQAKSLGENIVKFIQKLY